MSDLQLYLVALISLYEVKSDDMHMHCILWVIINIAWVLQASSYGLKIKNHIYKTDMVLLLVWACNSEEAGCICERACLKERSGYMNGCAPCKQMRDDIT